MNIQSRNTSKNIVILSNFKQHTLVPHPPRDSSAEWILPGIVFWIFVGYRQFRTQARCGEFDGNIWSNFSQTKFATRKISMGWRTGSEYRISRRIAQYRDIETTWGASRRVVFWRSCCGRIAAKYLAWSLGRKIYFTSRLIQGISDIY